MSRNIKTDAVSAREKKLEKRSTSTTRLRVEALGCQEILKQMLFRRERKNWKKEAPQLRVCVSRHSTGGDWRARTADLLRVKQAL